MQLHGPLKIYLTKDNRNEVYLLGGLVNMSLLCIEPINYTSHFNSITMARFITTIQLHDADEKDYKQLNNELRKKSFIETKRYESPNNAVGTSPVKKEYNREGNITLQDVMAAVVNAAKRTGKRYSFTIIRNKPVYA